MAYYINRTTKFHGCKPITVLVNGYSTREAAENALAVFKSLKPASGVEEQEFFIEEVGA